MKHSKKLFTCLAIVLCFSLCIGTISHAETVINYKEKNFGRVIYDLDRIYKGYRMRINSKGKLDISLYDYRVFDLQRKLPKKRYRAYAQVTFDSKGKKKVKAAYDVYRNSSTKYVYGNRMYEVSNTKLFICSKYGKVLKTIKPNLSKYLKKNHTAYLKMAEIVEKNKVRLYYFHTNDFIKGYGGIIEVNTKTGKVTKIISTNNYIPRDYDGKYVYGYKINFYEQITFYRTSLKTKKTETFKADSIIYGDEKYWDDISMYTFYNGKIMGLSPDGKVYFGTFKSKKFEQVGDISKCKNYKKYCALSIAMKSKNEFYIMYDPTIEAHEEPEGMPKRLIVVQYKNKKPE